MVAQLNLSWLLKGEKTGHGAVPDWLQRGAVSRPPRPSDRRSEKIMYILWVAFQETFGRRRERVGRPAHNRRRPAHNREVHL
jgi:hypothetical protein